MGLRNNLISGVFFLSAFTVLALQGASASNRPQLDTVMRGPHKDAAALLLAQAAPSATVKYDAAGRTATVLYTDQTCVAHKYNAQGNRTDVTVTKADTPETSVWGSGAWGCSKWAP
jgi:YD repeat-containing protein